MSISNNYKNAFGISKEQKKITTEKCYVRAMTKEKKTIREISHFSRAG